MKLIELVLHNVGVYHGRQAIQFATQPGRPVVLVGGLNGCGKTTLLDSLQLVLYGNRARLSNRGTQGYEDFLRATISRQARPQDGASISLTFESESEGANLNYRIVRAWQQAGSRIKESLDVFIDDRWDEAKSTNWSDHIEDLMPLEIASLFFFDGEKIEALADPERASTVIQTAVHALLGVSTLEQLRTDLLALQRRQVLQEVDSALDQRLRDLLVQHDQVTEALDRASQRKAEASQALMLAQQSSTRSEQAFARTGGDLYERRTALEAERHALTAQLDHARSQLRSLMEGPLPLSLVSEQLEAISHQGELEVELSTSQRFLDMLDVRDASVLKKVPAVIRADAAAAFAADRAARRTAPTVDPYIGLTGAELADINATVKSLAQQRQVARQLIAASEAVSERLAQVDTQLAGVPSEDVIAGLQRALEECRASVARAQGQRQVLDEDLDQLRRDRDRLELEIAEIEARRLQEGIASDDVRRVLEHSERVRETLASLRVRLITRHLSKIEIATLDSFQRLTRKEGLVSDLRIDPDSYMVTLTAASGAEISPSRLSAGERQLLAVALLWGLARVAGNRLPTVVDTPLGRLDSVHRMMLVDRYFPNASSQVILLSTDEEIDEKLLERLEPSIASSYTLVQDDHTHCTSIEAGYWWPTESDHVA